MNMNHMNFPPVNLFPPQFQPMGMRAPPQGLAPALYVGDVDENIREEDLYNLFTRFGQIYYIRLMKDPNTGRSRGFAYVNFCNPRDAEQAKHVAQYEKLGRKHIRIMYKRPNIKQLHGANIFVKNIDKNATIKDLHAEFSKFGTILSCKLAVNKEGESLRYGYVQFDREEDAKSAFLAVQPPVIIEGIDKTKTQEQLDQDLTTKYGAVYKLTLLGEEAYVHFPHEESIQKILKEEKKARRAEPHYKFKETCIDVTEFIPRSARPTKKKTNLFIKHLPEKDVNVLTNEIKEMFVKQFGEIDQMLVKVDPNIKKPFAFVCFKDASSAEKAYEFFNSPEQGKSDQPNPFDKEQPPLYVAFQQSKQERESDLKKKKSELSNLNNLYLKNLKSEIEAPPTTPPTVPPVMIPMSAELIKEHFLQYGDVISVSCKEWVHATNTRKLKFGFCAFRTPEEATKARNEAPDNEAIRKLFADDKPYINIFQPVDQRRKFLHTQFRTRHAGPGQMQNFMPFGGQNIDMKNALFNPNRKVPPIFPPYGMGPQMGGQFPGGMRPPQYQQFGNRKPMGGPRMGGGQFGGQDNRGPRPQGHLQGNRPPMGGQDSRGPRPQGGPQFGGGPAEGMAQKRTMGGNYAGQQQNFNRGQAHQAPASHGGPGQQQQKAQPASIFADVKGGIAGIGTGATSSITLADLKNKWQEFIKLDKDKQRNILGELLFPLIKERVGESIAPKITGMLIDLDVLEIEEIFEFLEDKDLLHERIEEAKNLILSEGN
jgi:polyadenylate-binding protein